MADIASALEFVLVNEGGYVNNPKDPGQCTNMGITKLTLATWRCRMVTCDEVKSLERLEVMDIYKVHYWDACRLDGINDQSIATAIFDIAVNRGVGVARQYALWACRILGYPHINDCPRAPFIGMLAKRSREAYDQIASMHPEQVIFLKGWHARADRLLALA